uniref:AAA+ ATPase domain-containing protein n=1 Tax=Leersia perrieri TaxID=77586 RepID=A0A0D9XQI3_9ORYZ
MAEAVMLVVSKIGSVLVEEITFAVISKLSEKVTNLKELPVNVKEIGNELTMMNNFIKRISTTDLTDDVKAWIAEVRELAHYVEDVLDKYSYYALKLEEENSVKKFFAKANYITVFSEIANEITQIKGKIKNSVKRKDRWLQLSELTPYPLADVQRKQSRDCLLELDQDDVVGIEDNRKQLTEWLYSDEQGSTVITVSGMGGLGKTTLVANVYEREKSNFNIYHWMVVSQKYDIAELLRKMLRKFWSLEDTQLADLDAHELKSAIKERLKDSKCLVVLDDVWNREAYSQIADAFQNNKANRIIITTRQDQIASLANITRQLKLLPLKHSDAFDLLCRKAFFNSMGCNYKCPQELEKLANDIVDRCQGLPLAIVSIGGMLSSMPPTHYVWNETYKQLRSEMANDNHIRAILNLSYQDLPGELRNCFLYCSLLPKAHQLSRETLVRLWVAEGFAVQKEENTPEEVADRYLRELIQRNMLEVLESDELGRVSTCKMHDLIRDLALPIAKKEKFGFANDFGTMIKTDREVRRLSLCQWKDKTVLQVKFLRLRTLVALEMATSPQLLSSVLSESSYLTVLELQDSDITEVPASIGNLFNLRYIGLQRTRVKSLPESIGKLSSLHTLNIKQTKIQKLPRGIVKVKKLRHLLADRYEIENKSEFRYFKGVQAPIDLSNLEELQTLETVEASKDLADQLTKLMQLRSLWIDNISAADCANLFATLSKMPLLSGLLLSASHENEALCFDALKPGSENLHRLIIRGCWAAGTLKCPIFRDHGKYLKYLAISWCRLQEDPLLVLASHVPNLTYLSLNRVSTPSALVLSAGCFPQLKTLALKYMPDVNYLEIIDGALQHIECFYVVSLPKLDIVPQGIESLRYLKRLWLLDLHKNFSIRWEKNGMHQKMQHVPELRVKD